MPQSSQLISAFGSGANSGASLASGNYNAQVARNNQTVANANADLALYKGTQAVGVSRQRTAQLEGAERAGFGSSGVDVNSGSALRTQMDTARIGEIDAQTITANAERSAWGFRQQADSFGAQASLERARGVQGAFASLISGGGDFAEKWSKYKQQGYNATNSANEGPWASGGPGE